MMGRADIRCIKNNTSITVFACKDIFVIGMMKLIYCKVLPARHRASPRHSPPPCPRAATSPPRTSGDSSRTELEMWG